MPDDGKQAVHIRHLPLYEVRHTMRAANLLYSAPGFVLRGPIYIIFLIVVSGFFYSIVATVDDRVTAPLELTADATTEQAPAGGYVRRIAVETGGRVQAFESVAEIQFRTRATMAESEEEALEQRRERLESEAEWQAREEEQLKQRLASLRESLQTSVENQKLLQEKIAAEEKDYQEQIAQAERQIEKLRTELEQAQQDIPTLETQLAIAREAYEQNQDLFERQLITKPELNQSLLAFQNAENALSDARARVRQIELSLEDAKAAPASLRRQKERRIMQHNEEILSLSDRISQLRYDIQQMSFQSEKEKEQLQDELDAIASDLEDVGTLIPGVRFEEGVAFLAPTYDGTVTEVHVEPGQQIASGVPLFSAVPDIEPLYAVVHVSNRNIGQIEVGDEVKIKYDTFPYQDWGIQTGYIRSIAPKPTAHPLYGSVYEVHVALEKETIRNIVDGIEKDLTLGLQGVAEIKTGEKRLIELIFAPISRWLRAGGGDDA
jgi:multidrug efflux pump subunit AcrA (membrane-fusion protein)